ncbi:MAG: hypothetical protein JWL83_717 [Actinomycetia bacterium]|nr:hypothetical protein [Actinomycetes bacterium]
MLFPIRVRTFVTTAIVVGSVAAFVAPTAAAAAAPKTQGVGSVTCSAKGKVTFNPPLTTAGTGGTMEKIKIAVKLSSCSGTGDGATIVGGSTKTLSVVASDDATKCSAVPDWELSMLAVTTRWKASTGSPQLANTQDGFNLTSISANPVTWNYSPAYPGTTGSFSGDDASAQFVLQQTQAEIDAACASPAGLATLKITNASTLAWALPAS